MKEYPVIKVKDGFIVVDKNSHAWGGIGYNYETNAIEFICSHPKYDEDGWTIIAHSGIPSLENNKKIPVFDIKDVKNNSLMF